MARTTTKTRKPVSSRSKRCKIEVFDEDDSITKESEDKMKEEGKKHDKKHTEHEHETNADQPTSEPVIDEVKQDVEEVAVDLKDVKSEAEDKLVQIKESELKALHTEVEDAKDRALRALAELDNFRKRTNRIMEEDRKYASMDLARAILPVWDNMGRALEAAENDFHPEAMLDGLKMMYQQFVDILHQNHIERIKALHEPFDPHFHESIASLPNAEFAPNTVIVESQPGFTLHDRVVRPTQVVLAAAVPGAAKKESSETSSPAESEE